MIDRTASQKLSELAREFKAVAVVGPRQSGKTTLVKSLFSHKPYVNLEFPDTRRFALEDPRGFLDTYPDGAVFDEIQNTPDLFSYLQGYIDESREKGKYILTGSNNFLLQQSISQSLAGRVAYLYLLPFSLQERYGNQEVEDIHHLLLKGMYPPVHDQGLPASDWARNYIKTYVERDVRQIKNISDLITFERFLKILAGRNAQELNYSAISIEVGVDVKTIQSWVGILESSFIIYLLRPHHKNFNKTVVKRPKTYFFDTALVCSLLGIQNTEHLRTHPLYGQIFEGFMVAELAKSRAHRGQEINLFYWRDKTGHEVDIIIDQAGLLTPLEIKSGKTIQPFFFKNLIYWMNLSGAGNGYLLYAGDETQKRSNGIEAFPWHRLSKDFI